VETCFPRGGRNRAHHGLSAVFGKRGKGNRVGKTDPGEEGFGPRVFRGKKFFDGLVGVGANMIKKKPSNVIFMYWGSRAIKVLGGGGVVSCALGKRSPRNKPPLPGLLRVARTFLPFGDFGFSPVGL